MSLLLVGRQVSKTVGVSPVGNSSVNLDTGHTEVESQLIVLTSLHVRSGTEDLSTGLEDLVLDAPTIIPANEEDDDG